VTCIKCCPTRNGGCNSDIHKSSQKSVSAQTNTKHGVFIYCDSDHGNCHGMAPRQ
jgi:hypothetical protein